jgi:BirA family transcriptional regulator, biotin operon repressor / biotin---[acetyl-CoA-carboxylase] ligase
VADSFDISSVRAALAGTAFAGHLQHLPTVGSTNLLALEAAQAGAEHGSVWVADEQTAGRGRGGHIWHSIPGDGLYLSVLLRPRMALVEALWLSLATGLAAQAAIAAVTGLRPDIRWPNDLLIHEKKCGGILVETSAIPSHSDAPTMLRHAVIGIGINVNHRTFPEEIEPIATSLRRESGDPYSRERVMIELLSALDQEIHLLEDELHGASTHPQLLERFEGASSWVRGKRVRVDEDGGYTGVTTGLDPRGFLRVAGDDGEPHTVLSGGVRPF